MENTNWKNTTLKELTVKVLDNRGKTPPLSEEGIILLQSFSLVGDGRSPIFTTAKTKFVDQKTYEKAFRSGHPIKDDIIIATNGSLGEFCIINEENLCIAQDVIGLRFNKEKVDPNYMYYKLLTKENKNMINNLNTGSTRPSVKVPHLLGYKISIHENLEEQKKIASILKSLDEKIEVNNQMNKTLEEMAQTIFKEWFVEFNFPNEDGVPYKDNGGEMEESELGMIPKGWRVEEFYNIAEFVNGKVFKEKDYCKINKKLPIVKIAELKSGITSQTRYSVEDIPEKYFLKNSNILFSWSGNPETSLDAFIWTMGKAVLNQHIFKVDKKNISKGLIYTILKYHMKFFKEMAKNKQTTGLGHVTVKNLKEYKIPIPNDDILEKIEGIFKGYFEKIFSIHLENQTLINTRDTLLPKLMSGEVRI